MAKAKSDEDKAKAREDRRQAQAAEEQKAWAEIKANADKAVTAYSRRNPVPWCDDLENEILDRLANGQSLSSICEPDYMPAPSSVLLRVEKSPSFAERYSRAREQMGSVLFDQCLRIADDDSRDLLPAGGEDGGVQVNHAAIQRDRMRIDTRFRMAGKFNLKLADKPPADGAGITVNHNTLNIDARSLNGDQRESLRQLLLSARDKGQTIDNGG